MGFLFTANLSAFGGTNEFACLTFEFTEQELFRLRGNFFTALLLRSLPVGYVAGGLRSLPVGSVAGGLLLVFLPIGLVADRLPELGGP